MNQPEPFLELSGLVLLAGIMVMIGGSYICVRTGLLKDRDQQVNDEVNTERYQKVSFRKGLIFCILSGLLLSLLNFGFMYGTSLTEASTNQVTWEHTWDL